MINNRVTSFGTQTVEKGISNMNSKSNYVNIKYKNEKKNEKKTVCPEPEEVTWMILNNDNKN
jgi:hypothetical protein